MWESEVSVNEVKPDDEVAQDERAARAEDGGGNEEPRPVEVSASIVQERVQKQLTASCAPPDHASMYCPWFDINVSARSVRPCLVQSVTGKHQFLSRTCSTTSWPWVGSSVTGVVKRCQFLNAVILSPRREHATPVGLQNLDEDPRPQDAASREHAKRHEMRVGPRAVAMETDARARV